MKRICKKCSSEKNIDDFPRNKNKNMGYGHTCKQCSSEQIDRYYKTQNGLISSIYNGQKKSCLYRGYEMPSYSKQELKEWILNNNCFDLLYKNWVSSQYLKDLRPSIDRLDDYKTYTIDNIQLITWKENREKLNIDKINGVNNKQSKAVVATIKGTNLSSIYYSIAEASRVLNINAKNIIFCCQNKPKYKTAGGYEWKYF